METNNSGQVTAVRQENKGKSEKLAPAEWILFRKWFKGFLTLKAAYEELGVSKKTMDRFILKKGQGHPDTVAKARGKIGVDVVMDNA